jgi:hypothetical protein
MNEAAPTGSSGQGPDDTPVPGEQPEIQQIPPIDDAPVPPLTAPDDTHGG